MKAIAKYLKIGEVSNDGKETHKIWVQSTQYSLINGQLYRRSFRGPYLRYLNNSKKQYVLVELHERVCDNHFGGHTLTYQAYSKGYNWPTMKNNAESYVKKVTNAKGTPLYLDYHLNVSIWLLALGHLCNVGHWHSQSSPNRSNIEKTVAGGN